MCRQTREQSQWSLLCAGQTDRDTLCMLLRVPAASFAVLLLLFLKRADCAFPLCRPVLPVRCAAGPQHSAALRVRCQQPDSVPHLQRAPRRRQHAHCHLSTLPPAQPGHERRSYVGGPCSSGPFLALQRDSCWEPWAISPRGPCTELAGPGGPRAGGAERRGEPARHKPGLGGPCEQWAGRAGGPSPGEASRLAKGASAGASR